METDQQDQQDQEIIPTEETQEETQETQTQERAPIKNVKTFWERLDEVLTLNLESQQMRDKVETLLEEFPNSVQSQQTARSFLFQPERIVISSNDDVNPSTSLASAATKTASVVELLPASQSFSSFRVRFQKSLIRVKSIQLLSAVIPNAIQNIPDSSIVFYYYKIRSILLSQKGAWLVGTVYRTGDIVTVAANSYVNRIDNTGINPTLTYWTVSLTLPPNPLDFLGPWSATRNYNTVGKVVSYQGSYWTVTTVSTNVIPGETYWIPFQVPADTSRPNYYDIDFNSLQFVQLLPSTTLFEQLPAPLNNPNLINRTYTDYQDLLGALQFCASTAATASIANDVSFAFNQQLNKFVFVPNVAANPGYYYIPCGSEDQNVTTAQGDANEGYTLNLRLGFTWNGLLPDPFIVNPYSTVTVPNVLYPFMRPIDPLFVAAPFNKTAWASNTNTANSYADLVNTSCVRIYADVAFGSTQDSNTKDRTDAEGILSIVPVNTTNLGVAFYQNNFNNELTKIPSILTEIGIRLVTDQGKPYLLPNSATVLLELAISYE